MPAVALGDRFVDQTLALPGDDGAQSSAHGVGSRSVPPSGHQGVQLARKLIRDANCNLLHHTDEHTTRPTDG
jgi:hypothetical protein